VAFPGRRDGRELAQSIIWHPGAANRPQPGARFALRERSIRPSGTNDRRFNPACFRAPRRSQWFAAHLAAPDNAAKECARTDGSLLLTLDEALADDGEGVRKGW